MTDTIEVPFGRYIGDTVEVPAHVEDMTPEDRLFVEFLADQIDQERRRERMHAKVDPVEQAHRTFPYHEFGSFADTLGHIGNLLMGAAGILRDIAMLPEGTFRGYPEWQIAARDAAEMKAAAEQCYAEHDRHRATR